MRTTEFYKPSNSFSAIGFILMILSMTVAGIALSWVYLILNKVIPLVYLDALIAFGLSLGLGAIGAFFVKTYKMRNPAMALVAAIIALLIVNLVKWAIYVSRDNNTNIYKEMKAMNADEYYAVDDLGLTTEDEVEEYIELLKETKMSIFIDLSSYSDLDSLTKSQREKLENETIWEYFDYENILGSDAKEVMKSIEKAEKMNAYDFTFSYRGLKPHNTVYLLTHPSELWSEIKEINEVGRWTMGKATSTYKSTVNGWMLWIVWFGELLALICPALYAVYERSSYPFIEAEDEWAIEEKTDGVFRFYDPSPNKTSGARNFKNELLQSPDYLLVQQPVLSNTLPTRFYTMSYCHSKYFDEIFITVKCKSINQASRKNQVATNTLLSHISVDPDYICTVYGMFGIEPPTLCKGTDYHEILQQEKSNDKAPTSDPVQSMNYDDIFNQPTKKNEAEKQAEKQVKSLPEKQSENTAPEEEEPLQTTGIMDGVDTSRLVIPPKESFSETISNSYSSDGTSGQMDGLDTSNLDLTNL